MAWTKVTIHTSAEAEEAVGAILAEEGITGIQIEDARPVTAEESGGLFGDVVPEFPADDGRARISFYVEEAKDADALAASLLARLNALSDLLDVGELSVTTSRTAEEDWINNWKRYFHSFRVDDLEIIPSWEEKKPDPNVSYTLSIDPGTAFGTGAHASTQLAIRALRRELQAGDAMLDIGTGSGILGIIALKEGAACVFGTDLDENVPPAVAENLEKNEIDPAGFHCALGDLVSDEVLRGEALAFAEAKKAAFSGQELKESFAGYDIVVANIIAEILAEITPAVPQLLKPGGLFITSGILQTHAEVIRDALSENGFVIEREDLQDEWESITARRMA